MNRTTHHKDPALDVASVEIIPVHTHDDDERGTELCYLVEWKHSWNVKLGRFEIARNFFPSREIAEDFRARITTIS
ncbi:hypothetical protein LCGC14_2877940 [marine sediment metagenome]|uniref:Uncharacterized protein n=1 Tax=marine sediment metagenome TaxID=412755 RepID=A0A0F9A937_9ZZZZ